MRYETIADQIMNRKENWGDFSSGVNRFIIGLAKKVILANNLACLADMAFDSPNSELTCSFAWLGAIAYTLQIYYDFSGYSDMAIGLGRMFGFHFMENFNYPYISKSTSEFWRRWHISLGTWFKDYLYFPLGGSHVKSKFRIVFNLFVVWLCTGIWHGANWTFVLWGLLYFTTISFEKMTNFEMRGKGIAGTIGKHFITMIVVILGWVLFRSDDLQSALLYTNKLFQFCDFNDGFDKTIYFVKSNAVFLISGILFSTPIFKKVDKHICNEKLGPYGRIITSTIYSFIFISVFLISISYLVRGGYNPFIYFNF